jgi:hypothetical protein
MISFEPESLRGRRETRITLGNMGQNADGRETYLSADRANPFGGLLVPKSDSSPFVTLFEHFSKMRASEFPLRITNQQLTSYCQKLETGQVVNQIVAGALSNTRFVLTGL